MASTAMGQCAQERPLLTVFAETEFGDCSPAFVEPILVEELGVAVHAEGSAAEVRLEDNRVVLK